MSEAYVSKVLSEEAKTRSESEYVFQLLLEEANRVGWPKYYKEDLDVDRDKLAAEDAPKEFGWVLRELGTYILDPRMSAYYVKFFTQKLNQDNKNDRFYWFRSGRLKSVTLEEFCERLKRRNKPSGEDRHNWY